LIFFCPKSPEAVLKRLIGLFPSVIKKLERPSPCNNLACKAGPDSAIDFKVSRPIDSTTDLNFPDSISANSRVLVISRSSSALR